MNIFLAIVVATFGCIFLYFANVQRKLSQSIHEPQHAEQAGCAMLGSVVCFLLAIICFLVAAIVAF